MNLERELRTMLKERAEAVTPDPGGHARDAIEQGIARGPAAVLPLAPPRRRNPWIPAVAAAAVAAASLAVVTFAGGSEDATETTVAAPSDGFQESSSLPSTGAPIFGAGLAYADPASVASAYLLDREIGPSPVIAEPVVDGDEATIDYQVSSELEGTLGRGRLHLWNDGEGWVVITAVAEGVTVDEVVLEFTTLRIMGSVNAEQASALRITDPQGNALARQPSGEERLPLAGEPGGFDRSYTVEPSAGHTQVVVEILGGSVFAVTEFSVAQPPLPLQRFDAGTDPVEAATEFATGMGWNLRSDGEARSGPGGGPTTVVFDTTSGEVQVVVEIDREGRVVVTDAWNSAFDGPSFRNVDGEVTGRFQSPVAGEATVVVTPFFSEFADTDGDRITVDEGEVNYGPIPHPTDGSEPLTVRIELPGPGGEVLRAILTV